jgi:hypothetical protein
LPAPEWQALQTWLATQKNEVVIPFANVLAEPVPPAAVRLRRDFGAMLSLVRAHALLHQAKRDRDAEGRIVADFDDYAIVADLLAPVISEGIGATVPETIRQTMRAVEELHKAGDATTMMVAGRLDICRQSAQGRLATARNRGYVKNLEDKRGRPARWSPADPLPEDQDILPSIDAVIDAMAAGLHPCTLAQHATRWRWRPFGCCRVHFAPACTPAPTGRR